MTAIEHHPDHIPDSTGDQNELSDLPSSPKLDEASLARLGRSGIGVRYGLRHGEQFTPANFPISFIGGVETTALTAADLSAEQLID